MAIYNRKTRRARAKKRGGGRAPGTRTPRTPAKELKKRRRKRVSTRPIKKKRRVVKVRVKRTRPKTTAKKRKAVVTRKRKPAKKLKAVVARKPAKKLKTVVRRRKARKPTPKKIISRRPKLTTKQRVDRAKKAAQTRARNLLAAQRKARGQAKRSIARKKAREQKKAFEENRLKRSLIIEDLPRATPKERKESAQIYWDKLRRKFRSLLREAEETGQAPSRTRLPRRIDSHQRTGEQRMVRINRILSHDAVEDILYRVDQVGRRMSGIFSVWWADLGFSGLGERLFGSGNIILKSDDPDARMFQAQGYDSTGVWNTYQGMSHSLERLLEDYASTPRSVVYLHYVRIQNFNWK